MNGGWDRIQSILLKKLKPGIFQLWIKPLKGALDTHHLTLVAPNAFVASWVKNKLASDICEAAAEILGTPPSLSIDSESESREEAVSQKSEAKPIALPLQYHHETNQAPQWRYCFEDFMVGPCNEMAYVACNSISKNLFPADQLFLCSGPGLGKTHLLQAIGSHFNQTHASTRVGYVTAEHFCNQMIMAFKAREIEKFKARYRDGYDVLMVEDIHFFQGKEKMQEELLATIKYFQDRGRKVVFSSSFLPKELSKLDGHLASQFCSGFLTVIQEPDLTLRKHIVLAKAKNLQIQIPENVTTYVAETIRSDIRQLESCIRSLAFKARLLNQQITLDLAREVIRHYAKDGLKPDIDNIIGHICRSFSIPLEQLRSKSKRQEIVHARNTAFYLARMHTNLSLQDIGDRFNRRHSTVIKGISNVESELHRETSLGRQLKRVIDKVSP